MSIKSLCLSLSLLTSSCVTIPDIKVCTVAGSIAVGADCATTNSGQASELDREGFVEFLLPVIDVRPGAMCTSAHDFKRIKTALEQCCERLGKCSEEVLEW